MPSIWSSRTILDRCECALRFLWGGWQCVNGLLTTTVNGFGPNKGHQARRCKCYYGWDEFPEFCSWGQPRFWDYPGHSGIWVWSIPCCSIMCLIPTFLWHSKCQVCKALHPRTAFANRQRLHWSKRLWLHQPGLGPNRRPQMTQIFALNHLSNCPRSYFLDKILTWARPH